MKKYKYKKIHLHSTLILLILIAGFLYIYQTKYPLENVFASDYDNLVTLSSLKPVGGSIRGVTPPSQEFQRGSIVGILAVANKGYIFTGWGGACSGKKTVCSITMNSDKGVTANFRKSIISCDPLSREEAMLRIIDNPYMSTTQKREQLDDLYNATYYFGCKF